MSVDFIIWQLFAWNGYICRLGKPAYVSLTGVVHTTLCVLEVDVYLQNHNVANVFHYHDYTNSEFDGGHLPLGD